MEMDYYKLKVFCVVAETKSISRAAEILSLTLPAVSIYLLALEDIFGARLINRAKSGSDRLTPAGEAFYRSARRIIRLYGAAKREVKKINPVARADIRIGAVTTFESHVLPGIVCEFNKKHPHVRFAVAAGNSKRIYDLLQSGSIDLGIIDDVPRKKKVLVEPLTSDELFVIVPSRHRWTAKKSISVHKVAKKPLILREEGSGTRRIIDRFLAFNGIGVHDLNIPFELTSPCAINDAVESGMGISIASKWSIRKEVQSGSLVPIPFIEGNLLRRFDLIVHPNVKPSSLVCNFIDYLGLYPYDKTFGLAVSDDGGLSVNAESCQARRAVQASDNMLSLQSL